MNHPRDRTGIGGRKVVQFVSLYRPKACADPRTVLQVTLLYNGPWTSLAMLSSKS